MENAPHAIHIKQGALGRLGTCRVGVISVGPGGAGGLVARLALSPAHATQADRNDLETQATVREGDLVPIGGSLHRVLKLEGRSAHGPGSVTLDSAPTHLPGVRLHTGSMLVQLGDTGELHGRELEVERIQQHADRGRAQWIAHVAQWPNDFDKEDAGEELSRTTVSVGDELTLGPHSHPIVAIVPPDPERHLPGWIELGDVPLKR